MKSNRLAILIFIFVFQGFLSLSAQSTIDLINPSFEDLPRKGTPGMPSIRGWRDCGLTTFPAESPPDIHPVAGFAWQVSKEAQHGKTYLGLVVRYNDTYEGLSQAIESPLKKGKCYSLSVYLSKSDLYKSATNASSQLVNFTRPAVFQIWGGNKLCELTEMLAESSPVENNDWQLNEFILAPGEDYKFISILAFYQTPMIEPYNGHVLVDNMSPITIIECN